MNNYCNCTIEAAGVNESAPILGTNSYACVALDIIYTLIPYLIYLVDEVII